MHFKFSFINAFQVFSLSISSFQSVHVNLQSVNEFHFFNQSISSFLSAHKFSINKCISSFQSVNAFGKLGGLVVEYRTPEGEFLGLIPIRCLVFVNETF